MKAWSCLLSAILFVSSLPMGAKAAELHFTWAPRWEVLSGYTKRSGVVFLSPRFALHGTDHWERQWELGLRVQRESRFPQRFSGYDGELLSVHTVWGNLRKEPTSVGGAVQFERRSPANLTVEWGISLAQRTLEVFGNLGALEAATEFVGPRLGVGYQKSLGDTWLFLCGVSGVYGLSVGAFRGTLVSVEARIGIGL